MNQNEFRAFSELLSQVSDYYRQPLKPASIRLYWNALSAFDFEVVKGLLNEHVQTSRFMPTIAELLDMLRVMDGRPNVEEAWAIVARSLNDEGMTVVWTEEMASAFGVALGLQEDRIAARMAFKEAYESAVRDARRAGRSARWTVSLGHDPHGREGPLLQAVKLNRLSAAQVTALIPDMRVNSDIAGLLK